MMIRLRGASGLSTRRRAYALVFGCLLLLPGEVSAQDRSVENTPAPSTAESVVRGQVSLYDAVVDSAALVAETHA